MAQGGELAVRQPRHHLGEVGEGGLPGEQAVEGRVAEQLQGQPVNEVFDSEYRKLTAAVTLDYSLSADDSFLFTENMVTAHPWHAA